MIGDESESIHFQCFPFYKDNKFVQNIFLNLIDAYIYFIYLHLYLLQIGYH